MFGPCDTHGPRPRKHGPFTWLPVPESSNANVTSTAMPTSGLILLATAAAPQEPTFSCTVLTAY